MLKLKNVQSFYHCLLRSYSFWKGKWSPQSQLSRQPYFIRYDVTTAPQPQPVGLEGTGPKLLSILWATVINGAGPIEFSLSRSLSKIWPKKWNKNRFGAVGAKTEKLWLRGSKRNPSGPWDKSRMGGETSIFDRIEDSC